MRTLLALCAVSLLAFVGCSHTPPNLTPQATEAFYGTRVIQSLDLLRDATVAANAQTPPLVSTATARKVVQYHESALKIIHTIPTGWQSAVLAGLDELLVDLPVNEKSTLAPYIQLAKTILTEVQ
jgi:hypothetical protein